MTMRAGPLAGLAPVLFVLALLWQQPASAAPPSAFGPKIAIGEPQGAYIGTLAVMPEHGKAGDPFTVTASNLPPNQDFEIVWQTVDGAWRVTETEYKGRDFTPVAYRMATVKSDAQGRASATFTTPEDFGFEHDIVLQQGKRLMTQAAYSVDMTVDVFPKSGPAGTPITFKVKGIGWQSLYNSWELLYDNRFTGWMSAVTTHGDATFTIPAAGNAGKHVIQIMHGALTFPYQNPEQNPAQGRPRFSFTFDVTPGAPVLPAAAQDQALKAVRRLPPEGQLVSSPRFSGVGEPVAVNAKGFEPGKSYTLNWTRVIGNRMSGQGWEGISIPVAEAKADASGMIAFAFKTPDDLGGTHGLWVEKGKDKLIGTHVVKATAFPLDVAKGPVGTTFKIHLKGVGWTETSNILHVVYDNSYNGYVCAFNSQGDVEIIMQATGAPGWHFIDLYPGIYKGVEDDKNLSNFRIPQLTYADDHPNEDLGAFHFAFEVTGDETVGQVR
jgi:hypothetical protein